MCLSYFICGRLASLDLRTVTTGWMAKESQVSDPESVDDSELTNMGLISIVLNLTEMVMTFKCCDEYRKSEPM